MRVLWLLAAAAALAVAATDTTTGADTTTVAVTTTADSTTTVAVTTADVTTTAGATTTAEVTTVTGSTAVPTTASGVTTTIGGATTTVSGSSTTVVPSTTVVTTIDPCIVPTTAAQSTTHAGTTSAGQTTTGGAGTTIAGTTTTAGATTTVDATTTEPKLMAGGSDPTTTAADTTTAGAITTTVADTTTAADSTTAGVTTTVADTTTAGATTTSIEDSTTAGGSTTTGAATTAGGATTTAGSGTTTSGASTTSGFTTTSAVPVTTNCVTTTTMATTTTTPLINNKDFVVSCADSRCKYTLNAPAQDAAFLNEEEKQLNTVNNTLFGISSDVSGLNDTYSLDAENVTAQIADWQTKLDDINNLLASISIANLSSLLDTAEKDASDAQEFVLLLELRKRDSCLYQSCLAPTTPSTTTTTTPVPTTTLDQCASGEYKCENGGTCAINSVSGQPYCECRGDLDGQKHCSTGRCGAAADPTILGPGPLWSPGVNSSSLGNDTTSYASADCVWTMLPADAQNDIFKIDIDDHKANFVSICGDNKLWISNTFNNKVQLTSTTTTRQLSFVLNKGGPITLSLQASGDAPPPTGCYFALQMTEVPKPTKAPAEQRESAWKWWPW